MDTKTIEVKDIKEYLFLKKKREDLILHWMIAAADKNKLQSSINSIDRILLENECNFSKSEFRLFLPYEKKLEDLDNMLTSLSEKEVSLAIHSKDGNIYDAIKMRRSIVIKNFEMRDAIAKLNMLFNKLGYSNCTHLAGALRLGSIPEPIDLSPFLPLHRFWFVRLFQRLNFPFSADGERLKENGSNGSPEISFKYGEQTIWLGSDNFAVFEQINKEISQISQKLQLHNAERQVRVFSTEEEATYEQVQTRYLKLLKQRDDILQTFYGEEKLFL